MHTTSVAFHADEKGDANHLVVSFGVLRSRCRTLGASQRKRYLLWAPELPSQVVQRVPGAKSDLWYDIEYTSANNADVSISIRGLLVYKSWIPRFNR